MIRTKPESKQSKRTKGGPVNGERLKSFVQRIERLEEERAAIGADIKEVYGEVKAVGYDTKTTRKIVVERRMDAGDRDEQEALLETYRNALGMSTYREVAERFGISKSKLHRLVPRNGNGTEREMTADDLGRFEMREADSTAVDAGRLSPPSDPAAESVAVNPDPSPGPASPHIPDGQGPHPGTHSEIHRGAMQPKGCAEVMRADPSMSGSAVASGAAVRDADAMPPDVAAAPHSEGREHTGSAASAPPACADDDLTIPAFLRRTANDAETADP